MALLIFQRAQKIPVDPANNNRKERPAPLTDRLELQHIHSAVKVFAVL
ncbi:MAG: hypothetical protein WD529_06975 [Balneolaceae bacterium]